MRRIWSANDEQNVRPAANSKELVSSSMHACMCLGDVVGTTERPCLSHRTRCQKRFWQRSAAHPNTSGAAFTYRPKGWAGQDYSRAHAAHCTSCVVGSTGTACMQPRRRPECREPCTLACMYVWLACDALTCGASLACFRCAGKEKRVRLHVPPQSCTGTEAARCIARLPF